MMCWIGSGRLLSYAAGVRLPASFRISKSRKKKERLPTMAMLLYLFLWLRYSNHSINRNIRIILETAIQLSISMPQSHIEIVGIFFGKARDLHTHLLKQKIRMRSIKAPSTIISATPFFFFDCSFTSFSILLTFLSPFAKNRYSFFHFRSV